MQSLIEKAAQALSEPDGVRAESLFMEIIVALEVELGNDQKEMAQVLQRVSKDLEAKGRQDDAFRFKQRTCELMLRRSMELRMAARAAGTLNSPAPPQPTQAASLPRPVESVYVSSVSPEWIAQSKRAVAEVDNEKAEALYTDLICAMESVYGKNQKEIAAALKTLSKELESAGMQDEAFQFKQRTCEVMLKMSMSERRRNMNIGS